MMLGCKGLKFDSYCKEKFGANHLKESKGRTSGQ